MLFVVSIGHGVKYSRMNITQQGISHIPLTCSYRYTRSPVEDGILCDQEPRCIALYKKLKADGTRAHQTCICAIHPGNSTCSIIEGTHIFMPIHRSENRPGKSLIPLGPEHILQNTSQCILLANIVVLCLLPTQVYGTLCNCICGCVYKYVYIQYILSSSISLNANDTIHSAGTKILTTGFILVSYG